jgi:RNA polymerase sigma-70 factor (ECF subfamily)
MEAQVMEANGSPMETMGGTLTATNYPPMGTARPNDHRGRAIDSLIGRYREPVYCHLRHKGYDAERAEDLTQEFFQEVVLERNLISRVDPAKGQFRPFLFSALSRYLINVRKRESSHRRIPDSRLIPLDAVEPSRLPQSTGESTPDETCDYAWLSEVVKHVLKQVEAEYQEKGMLAHWHVFQEHVLQPIVDQTDCQPLKEVCDRYGVDETKASNMIVTVKRRFRRLLTQHLQRLAVSSEETRREVEEIRRFLPEIAREEARERR